MSFMLSAATAGEKKAGVKVWKGFVYTTITGSTIPQRVQIKGDNVNSASPVYMVQNGELNRTGAVTLAGILSLDPSISTGRRGR